MLISLPDKILKKWLGNKKYIAPADEGEAIGLAVGYYYATGKPATVAISADGVMNALNPITSLVIPEEIPINLVISIGRIENQHYVATGIIPSLLVMLKNYGKTKKFHFEFVK
jgi:sulfopyruvate decarboxylase TPP-binding subunit